MPRGRVEPVVPLARRLPLARLLPSGLTELQLMARVRTVNRLCNRHGMERGEAYDLVRSLLPEDDAEELYQHAVALLRRQR